MWGFQIRLKGEVFYLEVCTLPLWGRLMRTTVLSYIAGLSQRMPPHFLHFSPLLPLLGCLVPLCSPYLQPLFLSLISEAIRTGLIPAPLLPLPSIFPEEEIHSSSCLFLYVPPIMTDWSQSIPGYFPKTEIFRVTP